MLKELLNNRLLIVEQFCLILSLALSFLLIIFSNHLKAQNTLPLAFPGAQAFGRYTTGGRGGSVIKVTNLNDSGPGSLRSALDTKGPRIIVFEVSGNINLKSPLKINNSDVTIAGQTAPGDGITLQNYPLVMDSKKNIIVRYIRVRLGELAGEYYDAMESKYCENVIIDHCSFSWGTDEVASFVGNINLSVQWTLIAEALNNSVHNKGEHGYGGILGGKNTSFHHNLIAHMTQRNMRFDHPDVYRSSTLLQTNRGIVDFRNNLIYNWRNVASHGGEAGTFNVINNYYKKGPATINDSFFLRAQKVTSGGKLVYDFGKFYVAGNYFSSNSGITNDNWKGVDPQDGSSSDLTRIKASSPFSSNVYNVTHSSQDAYSLILKYVGASRYRDSVDERIIKETSTGTFTNKGSRGSTGGIIDSHTDAGGWPKLNSLPAPKDSDKDGMPDAWELENGLNPNTADDKGYKLSSMYTNIEVYINSLVSHISEFDSSVPPSVPQLESPINNASGIAKNSFLKWNNAPNAETYQLQISKTQDFATLDSNIDNLDAIQYSVENLLDNTQYFWRVRSKNKNGTSSWSSIWNFKTAEPLAIPETPKPLSPLNGSIDLPNTLVLEWSKVIDTKSYRVQVAKDESFSSMVYDIYNLTSQSVEIKNLQSGASFAWRVMASNDSGNSNFSEAWTFSTKISVPNEVIAVTGISISPTKASLEISKSLQLTNTVSPQNASNKNVIWTSSDSGIATVSQGGLVKGIKAGSAIITVKTEDGNFTANSEITVNPSNTTIGISGFTLVNADTDLDITDLADGNQLDINQLIGVNLNIRANTNPETVGSVSIQLSGPVSETITENVAPYALFGDSRGNYRGKILSEGEYTLEAVPYTESNLGGTKGTPLSIRFSIGQKVLAPDIPKLNTPSNNSLDLPTTLKLTWIAISNADTYSIQISKNADFSSLVNSNSSLTTNEHTVSGLQEGTQYYWRVRATNSAGSSAYSTVWNFNTVKPVTLPAIPTLISPSNGAKEVSTSPNFQWSSVTGAKTYRIQISKQSNFGTIVVDNATLTTNSLQVNNLEEGITYYWRVSASNEAGDSNFSEAWTFSTKISVPNELIAVTGISISPTKASLEISKSLQLATTVSPQNASNKNVIWTSSDTGIATVSQSGLVQGIKAGSVIITAKTEDGNFTANSEITVNPSNTTIGISGFTLVNADTDLDITDLADGNLLDINQLIGINLNIRANTNPETVGSISIQLSGPVSAYIAENVAPYALFGDSKGDYNGKILPAGDYTLEATPYTESNLGGTKGTPLSIRFSIGQKVMVPEIPKLNSPSNNSLDLPTTIKLTWIAISNADTYSIEISKNADFSSLVNSNSSLTTNEHTVSGLQEGTQYYWRVRATNSAGSSAYSTVWNFNTVKPVTLPAIPTLISPSNGAKEVSTSPNFQWSSVTGAKTYRIQISKQSNFGTIVVDNATLTTNSLQVNNLEEGITYYWRVSASNEAGNTNFSSVWSFQTKISIIPPLTPSLVSPSDNSTGLSTTLKLTWTAITNAATYGIEISKNPDFNSLVINNSTLTINEFTVTGLENLTKYYWRVRAINLAGSSPYSQVWSFTTKEKINPPTPPILIGPANESVGLTGKTTFTWSKPNGAEVYGIQISKDQNFSSKQYDISDLTNEYIEISNLEKGVTYFWRVNASNEAGTSEFSEVWKFETLSLPSIPVLQSPTNGKKDLGINSTLVWESTLGAESYRLQVSKSKDFSVNLIDNSNLVETSFNIENLEEGTTYFWRIRATNIAGNSAYSAIWEFTTEKPLKAPTVPILVSPTSGTILKIEDIVLEWKPVIEAERYRVQVSKYSNFSQAIVFDDNAITSNKVTIEGLEPNEVYFWRVMAINIVGSSAYSTVWNFITEALLELDSPILVSPGDGVSIDTTSIEFVWKSVEEAESYRLDVSSDSTFKNNVKTFTQIQGTKFILDSLERKERYFWKVTANGKRPSSISETWSFKVAEDQALLQARISQIKIKNYPNPFKDLIHLEFSRPIEGDVNISIFDSKGISVYESEIIDPKEGITLEIPKDLPKGMYVIKIQAFGVLESKRVVKH